MTYFVAENSGNYVSGVIKNPLQILYSTNIEEAEWHELSSKVQALIDRYEIAGFTSTEKGGDHPGTKPHIP